LRSPFLSLLPSLAFLAQLPGLDAVALGFSLGALFHEASQA
jgi:hypothetical protein